MTLTRRLEALAAPPAERAGVIALTRTRGRSLTFGELADRVLLLSGALARAGLRAGDRALYAVRPSPDAVALQLAVLRAGGVLAATDLGLGETVFAERLALLQPRWVLSEPLLLALSRSTAVRAVLRQRGIGLPPLAAIQGAAFVTVGRWVPGAPRAHTIADLLRDASAGAPAERLPQDDAFIVFTSGTTGAPKGVVHTAASVASWFDIIGRHLGAGPGSVVYASTLHLIVPALLAGATVLLPSSGEAEPARLLRTLEERGVTHVFGVPQEWQRLIEYCHRSGRRLPATLRLIILGAAPVRRPFLERLRDLLSPNTTVRCVYGMTEAAPIASITLDEKLAYTGTGDLLGAPFPEMAVRTNADDELIIRGPNLFRGYLGAPPVHEHATGDLAEIDRDGRIVLLGRRKDMMIRGQYNIYPELYESRIEAIAGVRRCALIGVYDETIADERIVLAVEPDVPGAPVAFERYLRRELAAGPNCIDVAALPDHVLVMELPLSGRSDKVDRRALRVIAGRQLCASS